MNRRLQEKLINIAKAKQTKTDPTHDFEHIRRVLNVAVMIAKEEKADLDVIIPAALFHDVVVYRKDTPESHNETDESAGEAGIILNKFKEYPREKINLVQTCIRECSFKKAIKPKILESKILQDADLLESTGVISIMRTFSSGGQMNKTFYNSAHPLNISEEIKARSRIGFFYDRLLVAEKRMHTKYAKKLAKKRTKFLKLFLDELKRELKEDKII